jgi:hypothetical protein
VEPLDLYRICRERGMDLVTISDHNTLAGALEIAHLPGTFLSAEVTTYFPEDGCKIHCLVTGVTEEQFRMIDELRPSIYELQKYLAGEGIVHTIAHPLFRVNDRLRLEHVEKLLVLFQRFEVMNGARYGREGELLKQILRGLTPALIEEMAERHGLEPAGTEPWRKMATGGSDDHCGVYAAGAYTTTPKVDGVEEFLECLRWGECEPEGTTGTSVQMAHSFYHIAYSYYRARLLCGADGKNGLVGALLGRMLGEAPSERPGLRGRLRSLAGRLVASRQKARLSEVERGLVEEFGRLLEDGGTGGDGAAPGLAWDRRTFQLSCRISQKIGCMFLANLVDYARAGRLIDSLQTVASLGPVALSIAPYLAAFKTQHKNVELLAALETRFEERLVRRPKRERRACLTDVWPEEGGARARAEQMARGAREAGDKLVVVTALAERPRGEAAIRNFIPAGTFRLPEHDGPALAFPPFLEMIEYLERERLTEIVILTPGPVGLTGLAAAKLLGVPCRGAWEDDYPALVRERTGDETLEQLTWRYVSWFHAQMDVVECPEAAEARAVRRGLGELVRAG